MNSPIHQDTRLAAFAEKKMRTWARFQETAAGAASHHQVGPSQAEGVCYVAISREAGAAGAVVARLVGERLGWEVYDRNLLDQIAERYKESRLMLDLVDETANNWVYDVLGTWMDRQIIPHEKYFVQLSRMIQVLARAASAVFVGRGRSFSCRGRTPVPCESWPPRDFAQNACGSGTTPGSRKPWIGSAAPTVTATSSSTISSTRTSTTRTSTTSCSMSSDWGQRAPPTRLSRPCGEAQSRSRDEFGFRKSRSRVAVAGAARTCYHALFPPLGGR